MARNKQNRIENHLGKISRKTEIIKRKMKSDKGFRRACIIGLIGIGILIMVNPFIGLISFFGAFFYIAPKDS